MVQMPYLEEKSDGRSTFIQVSKATLVPNNELCWISGKITGINIKENNSATPFLFEGEPELELGFTDLKLDLQEKNIKVPVFNDSVIFCNTIDLSQELYTNSEFIAFQCQDSELSQIFFFWKRMKKIVISMVFQQIIAVLSIAFPSKIIYLCLMIVETLLSFCHKIYAKKFVVLTL